jgi:ribosomal protein L11 methyltransferase
MYQVNLYIPREKKDEMSDILFSMGAVSVSARHGDRKVSLTALFENIEPLTFKLPDEEYTVRELTEEEWKNSWVQYCRPVEINSDVIILPFSAGDSTIHHRYPILIDPTDAFGDGSHPTTVLMMEEIYSHLSAPGGDKRAQLKVLDIGTGTGVLAILCEKMGVPSIDAFDNEEDAVERTKENIRRNNCRHITCYREDILTMKIDRQYDLVTANLLTGIIEESLENIFSSVKPGGICIMSGISSLWAEEMKERITDKGFNIVRRRSLKEWNVFVLKK